MRIPHRLNPRAPRTSPGNSSWLTAAGGVLVCLPCPAVSQLCGYYRGVWAGGESFSPFIMCSVMHTQSARLKILCLGGVLSSRMDPTFSSPHNPPPHPVGTPVIHHMLSGPSGLPHVLRPLSLEFEALPDCSIRRPGLGAGLWCLVEGSTYSDHLLWAS